MSKLTHFDSDGKARMVDVGKKAATERTAVAAGKICMQPETLELIRQGGHKKGDVLGVARVAAIMAAKQTASLIPMCHPLNITKVTVDFELLDKDSENHGHKNHESAVSCQATVHCTGPTGVEMEALTAVQIALLTIYDMCKAVDKGMQMKDIGLQFKSGGKSGDWKRS